ncbi:hypothetical protein GGI00_005410, partial [Coemansia sp. RSA 2681]
MTAAPQAAGSRAAPAASAQGAGAPYMVPMAHVVDHHPSHHNHRQPMAVQQALAAG